MTAVELETAAADALPHLAGRTHGVPAPGAACANCDAPLQGPYCHVCGQDFDSHKRSITHLTWEAIEGLLHLDGRLLRTLPALFLRPGGLARDYLEGRIARHVPPFRLFLVALLLYIFAAESAIHGLTEANARQAAAQTALLATPAGRASEAAKARAEADSDFQSDLKAAVQDRDEALGDKDVAPAKTQARYARDVQNTQVRHAIALDKADRIAKGLPPETSEEAAAHAGVKLSPKRQSWWREGLRKATANPAYYWMVVFQWGHRLAVLLLPIVGLSLALAYRNRPRYFVYDHLVVAMDVLSFVFLTNALALILPAPLIPWALGLAALWAPVNLFQTLRGAYGSTIVGATLKTVVVWGITVLAFSSLMAGLLVFSLRQL